MPNTGSLSARGEKLNSKRAETIEASSVSYQHAANVLGGTVCFLQVGVGQNPRKQRLSYAGAVKGMSTRRNPANESRQKSLEAPPRGFLTACLFV